MKVHLRFQIENLQTFSVPLRHVDPWHLAPWNLRLATFTLPQNPALRLLSTFAASPAKPLMVMVAQHLAVLIVAGASTIDQSRDVVYLLADLLQR